MRSRKSSPPTRSSTSCWSRCGRHGQACKSEICNLKSEIDMDLTSPASGARFIDPAVLSRIGNLELIAKKVVDGLINGTHRSPFFGASVDFAEHRGYVAGDDIRGVDWRVYARTDKYYIKEFEADSNANFSVLLDVSKSMGFGSKISKLDYGKTLAACLAYLANAQRDRVGLVTFDSEVVEHVPPSAKHLDVVLHTLDRAKPARPGELIGPLRKLAEHFGRRGIIVVISDFYAEPEEIFHAVGPIVHRDRKSTRLNSSHLVISYAVFCLKKKEIK